MEIYIKSMEGEIFLLYVNKSDTVEELKKKIYKTGYQPPDQQRLIFKRKQLEDEKTLEDYGIEENSLIHILLRLRGD
jgi:hypothetical protein